jgi:hypothetical protein
VDELAVDELAVDEPLDATADGLVDGLMDGLADGRIGIAQLMGGMDAQGLNRSQLAGQPRLPHAAASPAARESLRENQTVMVPMSSNMSPSWMTTKPWDLALTAHRQGHQYRLHQTAAAVVVIGIGVDNQPNPKAEQGDHSGEQNQFGHRPTSNQATLAASTSNAVATMPELPWGKPTFEPGKPQTRRPMPWKLKHWKAADLEAQTLKAAAIAAKPDQ